MKKIILLGLFCAINLFAQDTIIDFNRAQYNYANQISSERLKDAPPFPCSCPCSTMVKSAYVHGQQGDDELFLYGGYRHTSTNRRCQRIELNISACNNQSVPKLFITFPSSSDDCLKENFWLYREDGGLEATYLSNFDPLSGSGELTIDPPIAPCSSRTVIFYICSDNIEDCEHDDYSMNISVDGQNPECDKSMTWHFDFILGKKSTNYLHLDMQDKQKIVKYNVKILNIFNLDVLNYQIDNLNEIKDISNQFNLTKGLYIINIYEKNILIYQDKLLLY